MNKIKWFAGVLAGIALLATGRADSPAVTAGEYRVEHHHERLRLLWKEHILIDDFMPMLIAKDWVKTYGNENYLLGLKPEECRVSENTLSLERNREHVRFRLAIAVDALKGFSISVEYHTPHPEPLEMAQLFLMLPQSGFEEALYYGGEQLKRLPPRLGFDPDRNSRERMSENAATVEIFRDFGSVTVSGDLAPFFLYDARYHIWKGDTQRSFALVADRIPDGRETHINLSVRPGDAIAPDAVSLGQLELSTPSPRHVILDDERSLDLVTGTNTITLTPTPGDPSLRTVVALFPAGQPDAPRLFPADEHGRTVFELPDDVEEIAFGILELPGRKLRQLSRPVPVLAETPLKSATKLAERLNALKSDRTGALRDSLETIRRRSGVKQNRAAFEKSLEELRELELLIGKLELLNRRKIFDKALDRKYFLYQSPSTVKIYNRRPLPAELDPAHKLQLSGARNEFLNFQVTAVPLFDRIESGKVANFRFKDAQGNPIPVASAIYSIEEVISGADVVPDLLSKNTVVSIDPADNSRSWWINFQIPAGIPAGEYTAELEFTADGMKPETMQAGVKVFDFELADSFDAVAIVGAFTHELRALPDYKPEMEQQILQMLVDHGFYASAGISHPRYMDDYDYKLSNFQLMQADRFHYLTLAGIPYVEWLEKFYTNGKLPSGDAYREMVVSTMLENAEKLKNDGKLQYTYAYYDEVGKNDRRILDFIRSVRNQSGVKFAAAFHQAGFGTDYVDFYADDVDLFYFSSAFLEQQRWVDYINKLKERGKKIGVYFNIVYPKQPTCNVIDAPALAHRTLFWTQWKYGIDYNLFWGINCWWANLKSDADPQQVSNRGDGIMLYRDIRGGGYALSLRLEIMREGVQDYRYLRMLNALTEKVKARTDASEYAADIAAAEKLLEISWLKDSQDVPLDDSLLLNQRTRCAQLIEKFGKLR